jgi:hypothetical protein
VQSGSPETSLEPVRGVAISPYGTTVGYRKVGRFNRIDKEPEKDLSSLIMSQVQGELTV